MNVFGRFGKKDTVKPEENGPLESVKGVTEGLPYLHYKDASCASLYGLEHCQLLIGLPRVYARQCNENFFLKIHGQTAEIKSIEIATSSRQFRIDRLQKQISSETMQQESLDQKNAQAAGQEQYGTFGTNEPEGGAKGAKWRKKILFGDETPIQRIKQFLAEFIGLFVFVFIGSLSGVVAENNLAGVAAAHGFTIALLIMGIGHISGGHLNPAVTVGLLVNECISVVGALMYILAQLLGGILGALGVRAVLRKKKYLEISGGVVGFAIDDSGNADAPQAWLSEVILTFVLVITVLFTAVDRKDNVLAPLAIGLAVFVDILAGAAISGASMNPARSFGPACIYSGFAPSICEKCADPVDVWSLHYIHWVGPICGGLIAGVLYRFAFAWDKKKD